MFKSKSLIFKNLSSFGQSAIFLIGGKSLDEEPLPILLHSGDIIIMSKEARLCYHGVPRIVESVNKTWHSEFIEKGRMIKNPLFEEDILKRINDELSWELFEFYVSKSRINLNIRQVLFSGQKKLSDKR